MSRSAALELPVTELHPRRAARLRVVLLGCGTVNGGVRERLHEFADDVEIAAIVTRRARLNAELDPHQAWLTELDAAFDTGPDAVIEALPDCPAAEKALLSAADRGIHIISANKAILARRPDIRQRAEQNGATVRYSAAVGGGLPVLETLQRLRKNGETITSVRGVLNGTSNFALDLLESGISTHEAVASAQKAGFAEEDPSADINGRDAAAKLVLISRAAFDTDVELGRIPSERLEYLRPQQINAARAHGLRYRQCAELTLNGKSVSGQVRLEALPKHHPFCQARDEENVVEIECRSGLKFTLHGRGAGRAPTANSVLCDLRALLEERC